MSREIDERVVSLQLENKQFERNANTSMNTLDKLKDKLNFKAAAKGAENLDAAVKKVDLSSIGQSADRVGLRFSAMYTIADQTFRNMVNSAEASAKRIISSFTIDPVKTGLSEYETKINAVQVIKANTRTKYLDNEAQQMEDITSALDELNTYADQTIYNFAQMTNNVGKFVAQGLGVEEAANAVKGMANLAAASGASAEDMARATYQMSQALGGTIRKIDWNSLRNANMATVDLKETLMDLARVEGIDIDGMIAEKGVFEDTLEEGWLTGSLFTEAMNIYSGVYDEATLKARGFTDEQIKNFMSLANTATVAATEVKTFTQLFDVLKETAQSGWTQTWEYIIGDFDTAKESLSKLQVYFSGIIDTMSDARNFVVKHALNFAKPWTDLLGKLDGLGLGKIKETVESIGDYTDKLEYFQNVLNDVWMGNYNNADTGRYGLLDGAGYDHRVVQDLVNLSDSYYKGAGWQYQLTIDDIRASHEKFGLTLDETNAEMQEAEVKTNDLATALKHLSDAQLEEAGLTKDEIKILRELQKESERVKKPIEEIADTMSKTTGRMLLIESLQNAWSGLLGIFTAIGNAWKEIFPPIGFVQLYNGIKAVKDFSENLRLTDKETGELTETAKNLQRIFRGVFAILDIVTTLVGGGLKIAFKAVGALLKLFGTDIIEVAAWIGDAAVALRDWMDSILDFEKIFTGISKFFKNSWKAITKWIDGLKDADNVGEYIKDSIVNGIKSAQKWTVKALTDFGNFIIEKFESAFNIDLGEIALKIKSAFGTIVKSVKSSDFVNVAFNCISGFIIGLGKSIPTALKVIWDFGKKIISTICDVLVIRSPSREFMEIGKNIILGLIKGVKEALGILWNLFKTIGNKLIEIIKSLDLGTVLAGGITTVGFIVLFKAISIIRDLVGVFSGLGDVFESVSKGISRVSKAVALKKVSQAVLNFAIAIGVLVASLYVLTKLADDSGTLWEAIGALAALAAIVAGLAVVIALVNKPIDAKNAKNAKSQLSSNIMAILAISGSILLLAFALKTMSTIDPEEMKTALIGMASIVSGVVVVALALSTLTKGKRAVNLSGAGSMLLKMAIAIGIMLLVIKMAAKLEVSEVYKGLGVIAAVELLFIAVIAVSKFAGEHAAKAGSMLFKMSIAMLIMVAIIAIAGKLDPAVVDKGIDVIVKVGILFAALVAVSYFAGEHASKAGSMIFKMGLALMAIAVAVKIAAALDESEAKRGIAIIAIVELLFVALIAVSYLAGEHAAAAGSMLIKMSVAMLILTGVIFILSLIKPDGLARAVAAIAVLEICFAGIIAATNLAKDSKGMMRTLIMMTVVIALLIGALIGLTFLDPVKLATAAGSISLVMAIFGGLLAVTKLTKNTKDMIRTLLIMAAVVAILAGIVVGLSFIDGDNAIKSCSSLAALMLAFAGMLAVTKLIGSGKNLWKSILSMTAMVVPLCAFVAALYYMPKLPEHIADNLKVLLPVMTLMTLLLAPLALIGLAGWGSIIGVAALTAMVVPLCAFVAALYYMPKLPEHIADNLKVLLPVMTYLTALLVPLTLIGFLAIGAVSGILALTTMIVPLATFTLGLKYMPKFPEHAKENIGSLLGLMTVLTDLLVKISPMSILAAIGVAALMALSELVVVMGAFVTAVGALNDLTNGKLEEFVDQGIPIMIKMAEGLGIMIGAFVAGIAEGVMLILPALGASLSMFMIALQGFIAGAKTIDEQVLIGVGILVGSILALCATELITGIVTFGGVGLIAFGATLSEFMKQATPFIDGVKNLDEASMSAIKNLADAILTLTAADVLNGLFSFATGGASLTTFGEQLPGFGTNVNSFMTNLGTLGEDQLKTVEVAGEVIKKLAEAADTIPNNGGWAGKIFGENGIGAFAVQLPYVASALNGFVTNLGTFDDSRLNTVNIACDAITALAKAADTIPNSGGWAGKIFGENGIGAFAAQLPYVGSAMNGFITNLGTFEEAHLETVKVACSAIVELSKAADAIPNTGGLWAKIFGDNGIGKFAKELPGVATNLNKFISNLGSFGEDARLTVSTAVGVIRSLATLADADIKGASKNLAGFGEKTIAFAEDVKAFVEKIISKKAVTYETAVNNVKSVIDLVKSVKSGDADGIKEFGDNLKSLGNKSIDKFIKAFTGDSTATKIKNAVSTVVKTFTDALSKKVSSFETAGKDFGDGLVKGIKAKKQAAWDAGYALGQAAVEGEKKGQKSNSPSKLTTKAGKWLGEGLVNGMVKMTSAVYGAGYDLGELATDSISSAVNQISSTLSSDIDSQPTITPVLDLSNVTSGANAISGLFSGRRTLTVDTGMVGVVASAMSQRQNGMDNSDVVSSLKALRKDLANMPRESITIEGITYDDGSNIADAVHTLVRAARIEGRV